MSLNFKSAAPTKKPESDSNQCLFALDFPYGDTIKVCKWTGLACEAKVFSNPTVHKTCSDKERYAGEEKE